MKIREAAASLIRDGSCVWMHCFPFLGVLGRITDPRSSSTIGMIAAALAPSMELQKRKLDIV